MKEAVISYPEEVLQLLDVSEQNLPQELLFLAAAKLYEIGRFTASQAAQLAQTSRVKFLGQLQTVGVPAINLQGDEVEAEIEASRELAG